MSDHIPGFFGVCIWMFAKGKCGGGAGRGYMQKMSGCGRAAAAGQGDLGMQPGLIQWPVTRRG